MADRTDTTRADAISAPLVTAPFCQSLFIEWHAQGLNIEMRLRPNGYIYALVEDARGEVPASKGRDMAIERVLDALRLLESRQEQTP